MGKHHIFVPLSKFYVNQIYDMCDHVQLCDYYLEEVKKCGHVTKMHVTIFFHLTKYIRENEWSRN